MAEKGSAAVADDVKVGDSGGGTMVFPLGRLLPKTETQISQFLLKHPKYDGRGVIIAVIDTGVDPTAAGLQTTSDGERKIVELMDCTGAGDVDTSTVKTPENGEITGLTGRKLKIPSDWKCPSGKYHIGVKNIYELCGKSLRERLQREHKTKIWDPAHRLTSADCYRQLEKHEVDVGNMSEKMEDKWTRENLNAQIDLVKSFEKSFEDCGNVADCLVFHDGSSYKACIDTSFRGKLDECSVLAPYYGTGDYAVLSDIDLLCYSVNIHDSGNVLEIVTTASAHGTHVASIAGAYFPDEPERNGLAPGAKIVSLGVGDARISSGGMETGSAVMRAMNRCVELGVDVINFSFGEAAHLSNTGRVVRAIEEVVWKHNILFVSSVGNNGPALSTGGAPGSTADAALGIGAFLTPEMMETMYSMRKKIPPTWYPWSSRGPTPDGALGVEVTAPGGAITSVPKWTLKGSYLMNGTSMSSPNATGAIACLMSGLKSESVPYSPFSLRMALINTAHSEHTDETFAVGGGMLQADAAYEYLVRHEQQLPSALVRYRLTVSDGGCRGVYLREPYQLQRPLETTVNVEPVFHEDCSSDKKVDFAQHLNLSCSADYVEHPASVELGNGLRQFAIKVNIDSLEKGRVHFTELVAHDAVYPNVGAIWRLPITVVVPLPIEDKAHFIFEEKRINCSPAIDRRYFFEVPEGAEWAVATLENHDSKKGARFIIHAVQLLPHDCYRSHESYRTLTMSENSETTHTFQVVGGRTLEVCLTKWWASLGETTVSFKIQFRGVAPVEPRITMMSSETVRKVIVKAALGCEQINPSVSLRTFCQPLKPTESKLRPMGPRDLFQEGRQIYQLMLSYTFSVPKSGTEMTADLPGLLDYLYESEIDSKIWMVSTVNHQFIFAGETYPSRYVTKLEKGEYRLKVQLRQDDQSLLERLRDLTAVVQLRLPSALSLDVHCGYPAALRALASSGGGNGSNGGPSSPPRKPPYVIAAGALMPFYITGVPDDKVPRPASPGCYLSGVFTLAKDESARKVSQYPFCYYFTDVPKKTPGAAMATKTGPPSSSTVVVAKKQEKTKKDELQEALRDLKMSGITKLPVNADAEMIYQQLIAEYPNHLPIYQAQLKRLTEKDVLKNADTIASVCDVIMSKVDANILLKYFGAKQESDIEVSKSEMEQQRNALVDALVATANVHVDRLLGQTEQDVPTSFRNGSAPVRLSSPIRGGRPSSFAIGKTASTATIVTAADEKDDANADEPVAANTDTGSDIVDFQIVDDKKTTDPLPTPPSLTEEAPVASDRTTVVDGDALAKLDVMHAELLKWVDVNDPRAVMFFVKHAVVHNHLAKAIKLLQKATEDKTASQEADKLIIELCEKLGWIHIVTQLKNKQLIKYPAGFRLF